MSAGDIHSILYRGEDPLSSKFRPKLLGVKKVQRYWPGKAPQEDDESADFLEEEYSTTNESAHVVDSAVQDRRLMRLAASSKPSESSRVRSTIDYSSIEVDDISRKKQRLIEENKEDDFFDKISAEKSEEIFEADSDIERRREKLRAVQLSRRKEEEIELANQIEEEEKGFDESSEEEDDSDYDDPTSSTLLKPIFVPKEKRDTFKEKEEQELLEKKKEEDLKIKATNRKIESQKLILEEIKKEAEVDEVGQAVASDDSEAELPNDDDGVNEEEEYELWKIRELKRIKRDKEAREARKVFIAEIEKRRMMSEMERRIDDKRVDNNIPKAEKKYKLLFMQKYYHKGAFFQDKAQDGTEELYLRDFHAPVGEDKMDKKILPSAMRLRRGQFGRAGQVKHTHLVDVDTTDFGVAWAQNDALRQKYQTKMAGLKGEREFDRPQKPKK